MDKNSKGIHPGKNMADREDVFPLPLLLSAVYRCGLFSAEWPGAFYQFKSRAMITRCSSGDPDSLAKIFVEAINLNHVDKILLTISIRLLSTQWRPAVQWFKTTRVSGHHYNRCHAYGADVTKRPDWPWSIKPKRLQIRSVQWNWIPQ